MVKEKAEGISQLAINSKAESLGMNLGSRVNSGGGGSLSASPVVHRRRGSTDSSSSRGSDKVDRLVKNTVIFN